MYSIDAITTATILLGAGFLVMFACRFVRISPIVGFLLAGLALGPSGFDAIGDSEAIKLLAKLGVVFLLFDIGLHFSFRSAWSLRKDLLGLAPLQVILCALLFSLIGYFGFGLGPEISMIVGTALALSSTAVVVQILSDLKQSGSPTGNTAKAVLVFQDIVAVFLLIMIATMGEGGDLVGEMIGAFIRTVAAVGVVIILGHYVLAPIMKVITGFNDPEMYTMFGLLIVMLTALATEMAGLSLTLGAFLAGMVIGETPYRVLIQTELRPFRSLLLALFFVTAGALLNPTTIWSSIGTVLLLMGAIMLIKLAVFSFLLKMFKRPAHQNVELSFLMAQGSEFAFVVLGIAIVTKGTGAVLTEQLIAAIALSMLLTPLLMIPVRRWSLNLCAQLQETICNAKTNEEERAQNNQPVFIIGMNDVGRTLARALRTHDIPYIAVERDRERFLDAIASGYTVAYGEPSDLRFWNMLEVDRSKAMLVAQPRYEVSKELAPIIKKLYPNIPRYVAIKDTTEAKKFTELNMFPFLAKGAPPGLEVAMAILSYLGIAGDAIKRWVDEEHANAIEALSPVVDQTNPPEEVIAQVA
jgi:CPA2 family monovalent cation:H+ antiporter-2